MNNKGNKNMRLRKHLTGTMSFYSHIPYRMEEYDITHDERLEEQIRTLRHLAEKLNGIIQNTNGKAINDIITQEAHASWHLVSDNSENPFAMLLSSNGNETNIKHAIGYAVDALSELPIYSRLLCNIHYMICNSPEYDKKYRGEYRTSPVWIGEQDCGMSKALFIPPVGDDMTEALADLEKFIHYNDCDVFIKATMIHYQFEMIHPFIDANGRTGRLLTSLFLYDLQVLRCPTILLSKAISVKEYNEIIQYVNTTADMYRAQNEAYM